MQAGGILEIMVREDVQMPEAIGHLDLRVPIETRHWLDAHPYRARMLASYLERLAGWVRRREGPFLPLGPDGEC